MHPPLFYIKKDKLSYGCLLYASADVLLFSLLHRYCNFSITYFQRHRTFHKVKRSHSKGFSDLDKDKISWDAFAELGDTHKAAFQAAAKRVIEKCGGVDALLAEGGLDFSHCGQQLESATGCSVYDEDGWAAKKVRRLADCAVWLDNEVDEDIAWTLESAREFLNTCATINSGIDFSF